MAKTTLVAVLMLLTVAISTEAHSSLKLAKQSFRTVEIFFLTKCPVIEVDPDVPMYDFFKRFFDDFLYSDGKCPEGYDKSIVLGAQFGYGSENRCFCTRSVTYSQDECPRSFKLTYAATSSSTSEEDDKNKIIVCPRAPKAKHNNTMRDYFSRDFDEIRDTAPEDGCCPPGLNKYIVEPYLSGFKRNICFCWVPFPILFEDQQYPKIMEYDGTKVYYDD